MWAALPDVTVNPNVVTLLRAADEFRARLWIMNADADWGIALGGVEGGGQGPGAAWGVWVAPRARIEVTATDAVYAFATDGALGIPPLGRDVLLSMTEEIGAARRASGIMLRPLARLGLSPTVARLVAAGDEARVALILTHSLNVGIPFRLGDDLVTPTRGCGSGPG